MNNETFGKLGLDNNQLQMAKKYASERVKNTRNKQQGKTVNTQPLGTSEEHECCKKLIKHNTQKSRDKLLNDAIGGDLLARTKQLIEQIQWLNRSLKTMTNSNPGRDDLKTKGSNQRIQGLKKVVEGNNPDEINTEWLKWYEQRQKKEQQKLCNQSLKRKQVPSTSDGYLEIVDDDDVVVENNTFNNTGSDSRLSFHSAFNHSETGPFKKLCGVSKINPQEEEEEVEEEVEEEEVEEGAEYGGVEYVEKEVYHRFAPKIDITSTNRLLGVPHTSSLNNLSQTCEVGGKSIEEIVNRIWSKQKDLPPKNNKVRAN